MFMSTVSTCLDCTILLCRLYVPPPLLIFPVTLLLLYASTTHKASFTFRTWVAVAMLATD